MSSSATSSLFPSIKEVWDERASAEWTSFQRIPQKKGEKVHGCGSAQRRKNIRVMQKAGTSPVLPSTGTSRWLKSRYGSHCSHLSISSETWTGHIVAVFTFTLFPLEMWFFYNSLCTWESDSKCVPLLLSSEFCFFSSFESPFRTCLLWKLSWLFQPVEPSFGIEIWLHFLLDSYFI